MAVKSLDDWIQAWNNASGNEVDKAYDLLRQYVLDSQTGVAGTLSPRTWFAVSERKKVQYLTVSPIEKIFSRSLYVHDLDALLRCIKQNIDSFYRKEFSNSMSLCEGDELLHVFQVIKEKTGVDYFSLDLDPESKAHSSALSI